MRRLTKQDIENIIGSTIEGHRVEAARIKDGPCADSGNYGFILARDDHGCYAKATIIKMVDKGIIGGAGKAKDDNGRPADLDLSMDMVRIMVTNDRAGLYD